MILVSWKGVLTQYIGRIERRHKEKTDVIIYDFVDDVPVAKKMYENRRKVYSKLGYQIVDLSH